MGCPSSRTRKHLYVYERALLEELILKYNIIVLTMNSSEQDAKTRFMPDHSEVEEKSKEWLKGVIRQHDESRSGSQLRHGISKRLLTNLAKLWLAPWVLPASLYFY